MTPPGSQRRALGAWCALMGVVYLLPVAYIALSSAGPRPAPFTAVQLSGFYYGHFNVLVAVGLIDLLARWVTDRHFYVGPFADFIGLIAVFVVLSSVHAALGALSLLAGGLRMLDGTSIFRPAKENTPSHESA